MIQDRPTSIRLSKDLHQWISSFAQKWNVSRSCVYRAAIKDFIKQKQTN